MPRPGPRPYECVRRAWHSDRHQPMRGSIIQQIFRVVHESHSSATRKNKEWQEKLPIVVLKAEEIMYSKANSEAEYMDLETLWDRVNDAIDTIIRKDETTETGDRLPPCVEAALNLGCVPVRASRSQRQANPRSYLSPRTEESGCVPPKILDNTTNEQKPQLPPLHPGNQLSSARPLVMNSTHLVTEFNQQMPNSSHNNPSTSCNFPLPRVKVPSSSINQFVPVESNTSVNVGSVYPLHYGADFRPQTSQFNFQVPKESNSIIVGRPIFPSIVEPTKMSCLQNLPSCEGDRDSSSRVRQADFRNNREKASETGFDLSLRLGLFEDPCLSTEKATAYDTSNVDSSSSQEGNMVSNSSPHHQNKEFAFFPVETANDSFGFHTSQRNFEGEGQSAEAAVRKRKSPFSNNLEDGQFFSQPQLRPNQFTGQVKRPGL